MTLVILGVAVATLARVASHSLSLAQAARQRTTDLQEKWGTLSCRLRLLNPAERVLGDYAARMEQQGLGWPHPSSVSARFTLAGADYLTVVADEQAKLNVNAMHAKRPDLLPGLLALAARESSASPPVSLRPTVPRGRTSQQRPYENWGQLISLGDLSLQSDGAATLASIARGFTCWGNERLNVTRATDASLMALCRLELTGPEASQIIDARKAFSGELSDLLDSLNLPRRKLIGVRRRLTDRSSCYTLWIVQKGEQRDRLTLVVSEPGRRGFSKKQVYQWP